MQTTTGIFIGRFQPAHAGHIRAIRAAAAQVDRLVVLIGSVNQCRSIKNPWTYQERVDMLRTALSDVHVDFFPLNDHKYNDDQWLSDVRVTVAEAIPPNEDVVLFGHFKTGNDYLKWFPLWQYHGIESQGDICATDVRREMFRTNDSRIAATVHADYAFYRKETDLFASYPFPETLNFNCADAVLVCAGHVLLIQRKHAPGAGTWALPGGFKNANETFLDCAIRELHEETNVRVPTKVLYGSVTDRRLFDSPTRSMGLPRNTMGVLITIAPEPDGSLPRANGADDAADVKWVSIYDALNKENLYDDHADIISALTGAKPIPAVFLSR